MGRTMVAVFVDVQGVPCWAMLLTDWATKPLGLQVLGFHMNMHHRGSIGCKATVGTLVLRILTPEHTRPDGLLHVI